MAGQIAELQLELVARTSHNGDWVAAKAELNDFRCERFFIAMKDFGNAAPNASGQSKAQRSMSDRFERCLKLRTIFSFMPESNRLELFRRFPNQLSGFGADPYGEVWESVKSKPGLLDAVRAGAVQRGERAEFVDSLGALSVKEVSKHEY